MSKTVGFLKINNLLLMSKTVGFLKI